MMYNYLFGNRKKVVYIHIFSDNTKNDDMILNYHYSSGSRN